MSGYGYAPQSTAQQPVTYANYGPTTTGGYAGHGVPAQQPQQQQPYMQQQPAYGGQPGGGYSGYPQQQLGFQQYPQQSQQQQQPAMQTQPPKVFPFEEEEAKDGVRFSWNVLPTSKADQRVVPPACLYTPLKEPSGSDPIPPLLDYQYQRCSKKDCGALYNQFWYTSPHPSFTCLTSLARLQSDTAGTVELQLLPHPEPLPAQL